MPKRKGYLRETPQWHDDINPHRFMDVWEHARGLWEVAERFRVTRRQASWFASVLRQRGHRIREFPKGGGHAVLPPSGYTRETWNERLDAMSDDLLWNERLQQHIDSYRVRISPFEWEIVNHVSDMTQWIAEGLASKYPSSRNVMRWVRDECLQRFRAAPPPVLAQYEQALARLCKIGLLDKQRDKDVSKSVTYRYSYMGHVRIPYPDGLRKYRGPASDMPRLDELVIVMRGTPLSGSLAA